MTDDPASSGREREGQGRSTAEPTAAAERSASQGARNNDTSGSAPRGARPDGSKPKRQRQTQTGGEGGAAKRVRREGEGVDAQPAAERSRRGMLAVS